MPVLIRIAIRDMWEHKAKSLIIGILVALGVIVIVLGNAMMDASEAGIRKQYIEGFTGDVMIHGASEKSISIFGVQSMSMDGDTEVPTVPDYERVLERVKEDPQVENATSLVVAYGFVSTDADETLQDGIAEDGDNFIFGLIFGVDADSYFQMFPSVRILKGRTLVPGESAVMLTQPQMEMLGKKYGHEFSIGDKVLINGFGTAGMRIREAEIVGVYEREGEESSPAPFIFTDVDTARVLGGLTMGTADAIDLDDSQTELLSAESADAIFSDEAFTEDMISKPQAVSAPINFDDATSLLGDISLRDKLNQADSGAWNFILIRLKDSSGAGVMIEELSKWFAVNNIEAQATGWKGAAGTFGKFADIMRNVFDIAILVITVVAIIIMMNTLVISVIERTAEIGTMRALGAPRSFVRAMFLSETLTLTVIFGFIGSVVAMAAIIVLNVLHIPAGNSLWKLLFGGPYLHLTPRMDSFLTTIVMVFVVGWLAHLYPVSVALKIQPVVAMQSE